MFTINVLPGFIMGFREGLEAFLIIALLLSYLTKTNKHNLRRNVYIGLGIGMFASIVFGLVLFGISKLIGDLDSNIAKLWESVASMIAVLLISSFIYWMIKHKNSIVSEIKNKVDLNPSKIGITLLSTVMVAREGAEIVLFNFTALDTTSYLTGTILGIILSLIIVFLISKSIINVNLKFIFNITLIYLILQAGFLLGYSVHEFLSYLKAVEILESTNIIYTKLFDLSDTFLYHKERMVGIVLYATLGWYSKPEVIQFIIQYSYTSYFVYLFIKSRKE
jgi:high-affinity iron transporter